jgi:hypothetical protein
MPPTHLQTSCRAPFGAYCETQKENTPTNSMLTRGTPAICLGPTGNFQGIYNFLSLVTGLLIKRRHFTKLPIPQPVIDCVSTLAINKGVSTDLVFADCSRKPYEWSQDTSAGVDTSPTALFPYISANIPGVYLDRTNPPVHNTITMSTDEPDWAQLADEAVKNADLDITNHLPPPPEIIKIDDKDDVPLPPAIKQTLTYLPKIEEAPTVPPTTKPSTPHCYPTRTRNLPSHLDSYHLFTTVAKDKQTTFPYTNKAGKQVNLAFKNENTIAHVCHYVMVHCAEYTFIANPNNKKQYGLKAGLRKFTDRENAAALKEMKQFHTMQ